MLKQNSKFGNYTRKYCSHCKKTGYSNDDCWLLKQNTMYDTVDLNQVKKHWVYTTASLDKWHEILGHVDPKMI
jgi:hypothetical protein